ncbi:MAG: winged helix-turn-helix domain-containing protein [Terriglobales bacterium]
MAAALQFGAFELDPATGELRRDGVRLRLQEKPLRLLLALLRQPGELVTRAELQKELWPGESFLDFEDGLNTAVRKLREALGDSAETPRYLETIPRRGYRWIAAGPAPLASSPPPDSPSLPFPTAAPPRFPWPVVLPALPILAFAAWWFLPLPPPQITSVAQLTSSARIDTPVKPLSDGAHVYYLERSGGRWSLMAVPVGGGEAEPVAAPGPSAAVLDFSSRTGRLLLGSFVGRDQGNELWTMSAQGGRAERLGVSGAGAAVFSPDGTQIAYMQSADLWIMHTGGSHRRKLAEIGGAGWLAWSPDGRGLRYTEGDYGRGSIWEISSEGRNPHRVVAAGTGGPNGSFDSACCGAWTRDGRYYIFTATQSGQTNLFALRERGPWWRRSPRGPFQLTHGPDSPSDSAPSLDGRRIFFYNGVGHFEPERVDPATGRVAPDPNPWAAVSGFSRDGRWIAYPDYGAGDPGLVRSGLDGSERLQLAGPEYHATFPRWAPDGNWIVFSGQTEGHAGMAYLVPSAGGEPQPLLADGSDVGDADWSSHGHRLVASRARDPRQVDQRELVLVDFASRSAEVIPGSAGLAMSRWSFDGRFISATSLDQHQLKLWDVAGRQWRVIARGAAFGIAEWSPDSRYLYFQDLLAPGEPLERYDARSGQSARVAEFSSYLDFGVYRCAFFAVGPDGAPVMRFDRAGLDLFAATVRLP